MKTQARPRSVNLDRSFVVWLFVLMAAPLPGLGSECVYMVDLLGGPMLRLNTETYSVSEVEFRGVLARDVLVVGDDAYIAHDENGVGSPGVVSVIDGRTARIVDVISVGLRPVDIKRIGGKLYVASSLDDQVDVIDLETHQSFAIETCRFPVQLSGSPDGARLYVGCQTGSVDVVDTGEHLVTNRIPTEVAVSAVLAIDDVLLVGTPSGIEIRDVTQGFGHVATMHEGYFVSDIAVSGTEVFASTKLSLGWFLFGKLNSGLGEYVLSLEPNLRLETDYNDVRVSGDGRRLFVSGPANLFVVDSATRRVVRVIPNAGLYSGMDLAPCPSESPPTATASPSATETATMKPSATPSETVSPTPSLSPMPAATPSATTTSTAAQKGGGGGGCSLSEPGTESSAVCWLLLISLLSATLRDLRRRRLMPARQQSANAVGNAKLPTH